ncbi:hypothetical protein [Marinobacter alexandrii]|uniref:hypothetical protein n=1 Tax=Marinobacter alexandrii TaxID=2570351 RepID=UPI003297C7BD
MEICFPAFVQLLRLIRVLQSRRKAVSIAPDKQAQFSTLDEGRQMKSLLAIPALFVALNATADCNAQRPTEAPVMPEGATATRIQMETAQTEAKTYVDSVSAFLSCSRKEINDMTHNFFVYSAVETADAYNQALAQYVQREEAVAMN